MGRGALLAALWMPGVLLVTGAIAPSASGRARDPGGDLGGRLRSLTDRLLPWPRSIALPAAVTVGAHVGDLVLGSGLIVRSLLGPNPLLGARFYGIGNELEITLAVATLLGTRRGAGRNRHARDRLGDVDRRADSLSRSCSAGAGSAPTSAPH